MFWFFQLHFHDGTWKDEVGYSRGMKNGNVFSILYQFDRWYEHLMMK